VRLAPAEHAAANPVTAVASAIRTIFIPLLGTLKSTDVARSARVADCLAIRVHVIAESNPVVHADDRFPT
jgi:hypothetical protein